MKISVLTYLVTRNLTRRKARSLMIVFSVVVVVAVLMCALALATAIHTNVLPHLKRIFPEDRLLVQPASIDISILRQHLNTITDETIKAIEHIEGVSFVAPQSTLRFPAYLDATILDTRLSTDVVVYGVPIRLVEDVPGLSGKFVYTRNPQREIPVVISRYFLDVYNLGYAPGNSLPRLSETAVIGRHFTLVLGKSMLDPFSPDASHVRKERCRIVGFTDNPALFGLILPIEYVREFNAWHAPESRAAYAIAHVGVEPALIDKVAEAIEALNYKALFLEGNIGKWTFAFTLISVLTLIFAGAVVIVALSNVAGAFALSLNEQKEDIAIMAAVGAPPQIIRLLFQSEAFILGSVGSVIGIAGVLAVLSLLNALIHQAIPFEFLSHIDLFAFSWWHLPVALFFSPFLCVATVTSGINRLRVANPATLLR